MVLDRVVVVWRVCWLCVVPRRWWVWWQGLVVVEYVIVWCGDVRYVGWVVRGAWLCWGRGGDVAGGGRCSMGALGGRGWEGRGRGGGVGGAMSPGSARMGSWHGLDVCRRWWLTGLQGLGAAVRWWRWALAVAVLLVCPGGLGVGWCGVAGPGPWSGRRALLAGALADPLTCLGLLGLVGVGGG